MRILRLLLGGLICAVGLAAFAAGGYLAVLLTSDGDAPHYLQGAVLVIAGVLAIGLGARLLGARIDWFERN